MYFLGKLLIYKSFSGLPIYFHLLHVQKSKAKNITPLHTKHKNYELKKELGHGNFGPFKILEHIQKISIFRNLEIFKNILTFEKFLRFEKHFDLLTMVTKIMGLNFEKFLKLGKDFDFKNFKMIWSFLFDLLIFTFEKLLKL